jgi:hypothetical protein
MKVTLNVLPQQYRCEPIDYKAIFFMVLSFIVSIITVFTFYIVRNITVSRMKSESEATVISLQTRVNSLNQKIQRKKLEINKANFDEAKKIDLNEEIASFNKIRRDFFWAIFFQKLEEVTPDKIWFKNIIIEKFPEVYMSCEGADIFKPIEYVKSLEMSEYFSDILLGKASQDPNTMAVKFTLKFKINEEMFKKVE